MRITPQLATNNVTIDPLDLNPRDAIFANVLVTDFDGEIAEAVCLLDIEQVLKVTIPSRPKPINNLFSLLALFIMPLISFFYVTSYALTYVFQTARLNDATNQALAISVGFAGLVATLC